MTGCTVVTALFPDPEAIVQLLADIDPSLHVRPDSQARCWQVLHADAGTTLLVVEAPTHVRVPGELQRLLGSDLGFTAEVADSADGLFWTDVHAVEPSAAAERLAILFARNLSERGHGSYVEHTGAMLAFPASTVALGSRDTPEGWHPDDPSTWSAQQATDATAEPRWR